MVYILGQCDGGLSVRIYEPYGIRKVRQKHFYDVPSRFPFMFADVDGIITDERGEKCIF